MSKLPETIGERIVHFRHKLGWSQGELLYACGWGKKNEAALKQGRISHYENNHRTPKPEDLETLAKALGTTPEVLTFGKKAVKVDPINLIPVLTIKQIKKTGGNLSKINDKDISSYHVAPLSTVADKNVFALRVDTEAMEPEFLSGDIVVLDTSLKPKRNDYVLVSFGRGDPILSQYCKRAGSVAYFSLNPDIRKHDKKIGKARVYGVVISKSTSYR